MSGGRPSREKRLCSITKSMKYFFPSLVIILISCAPAIRSTITSKQQPLTESDLVLVFQKSESFDGEGIEIGTIKAGDNGLSVNCSYNEVMETLLQMARSNGANIIKITEHKIPDRWSTCHRITAIIYRVPEVRKYEKEIVWSPRRKLTWVDFRGHAKPISNPNAAAVTYCGFSFESNRVTMFKKVKIYTRTVFDTNLSWVRPDQMDRTDLLGHEQTHFDLCEVYARILRKEIEERQLTVFNLNEANILFKEVYALYLDRQELYEQETGYGLNRQKQIEWTLKVGGELDELAPYMD